MRGAIIANARELARIGIVNVRGAFEVGVRKHQSGRSLGQIETVCGRDSRNRALMDELTVCLNLPEASTGLTYFRP